MKTSDLKYTSDHLEEICKLVTETKEEVILERTPQEDVVLVASSELNGLRETLHLLSSPVNARYLWEAIDEVRSNKLKPQTISQLRETLGFYE